MFKFLSDGFDFSNGNRYSPPGPPVLQFAAIVTSEGFHLNVSKLLVVAMVLQKCFKLKTFFFQVFQLFFDELKILSILCILFCSVHPVLPLCQIQIQTVQIS